MFFLSNYKLLVAFAGWELGSLSHLLPSSWYISPAAYLVHRYVPDKLRGGMISLSLAPANAAILFFLLQVCTFILNYNDTASHILTCIHNNLRIRTMHFSISMDHTFIWAWIDFLRLYPTWYMRVLSFIATFIGWKHREPMFLLVSRRSLIWCAEWLCYSSFPMFEAQNTLVISQNVLHFRRVTYSGFSF